MGRRKHGGMKQAKRTERTQARANEIRKGRRKKVGRRDRMKEV